MMNNLYMYICTVLCMYVCVCMCVYCVCAFVYPIKVCNIFLHVTNTYMYFEATNKQNFHTLE